MRRRTLRTAKKSQFEAKSMLKNCPCQKSNQTDGWAQPYLWYRKIDMTISDLILDESLRLTEFPVARESIFMAHAGVTILPRRVTKVMQEYLDMCSLQH